MDKLTIGIPTYNRPKELESLLKSIYKNNLSNLEEIIIIDNCSNYDIDSLVKNFGNKVRLIRNNFNIGQAVNMSFPFLHCKTKWLWIIGDDDQTLKSSISTILDEIKNVSANTSMIKFGKKDDSFDQAKFKANSLEDFIDYYHNDKFTRRGDLVYISNNVFNTQILSKYLINAFEYSYSYIGYLIPVFFALNTNKYSVYFSSKAIINYNIPDEWGWSFNKVGLGLSSLSHLPLNLSNDYKKKFLNITMLITFKLIINSYTDSKNNFVKTSLNDFKIIYNNIYTFYLPLKQKLIYHIFVVFMSNKLTAKMLITLLRFLKK
jgi:glycosyltransferase involved in cell wall biosynthesis